MTLLFLSKVFCMIAPSRFLLGFLIIFTIFVPTFAQEDISTLDMTILAEPVVDDASGTVLVKFIVDNNGIPVVDLTTNSIQLSETAEQIQLTTNKERSLHLAIIVDLSFGSDADLVRDTLRAFFDNYYLQQDDIRLYILDAGVVDSENPRVVSIDSLETAHQLIDELESSERYFSVGSLFQQVFEDLQEIPNSPMNSRQVLFVGSLLNRPSETSNTEIFAENDIAIHGVQAHRTREEFTTSYRGLANTGGGLFANNFEGIFVIPGEKYQPINNLKVLYDTISNSRVVYTLVWQIRNQSLESNRTVNISLSTPTGMLVDRDIDYIFNFRPPQVKFINQRSFDMERRTFRLDDLSLDFDLDKRAVPIEISFPDGVVREIASLRLQVIDAETSDILQSELVLNPELTNDQYIFTWSLSDYITPDSSTDVELIVTVKDELDLSASVAIGGNVSVPAAPPLPTATSTTTPTPTQTPTPEPTVVIVESSNAGSLSMFGIEGNGGLINLLLVVIAILAFVIALLVFYMGRIRSNTRNATTVAETSILDTEPPDAPLISAEPILEDGHRFAQLVAINGTAEKIGMERIWLDLRQMTIGRAETCDFLIDSPILDAEHCIISVQKYDEIFVRDLDSINGTFVNGERILGSEETFVPMGSELSLTKELVFEVWEPDKELHDEDYLTSMIKSSTLLDAENVQYKPLPGIPHTPDDGPPIEDNYSPN